MTWLLLCREFCQAPVVWLVTRIFVNTEVLLSKYSRFYSSSATMWLMLGILQTIHLLLQLYDVDSGGADS